MNPMDLKRGIDLAVAAVVEDLKSHEIGRYLAEAMQKVGNEGVITVEEAKSLETELEVVEGMQFDRDCISPYCVTNAEKMRVELEDPYVLIHEKKLSGLQTMLPLRSHRADGETFAHRGRRRRR